MIMPDPRIVLATSSVDRLRSSANGGTGGGLAFCPTSFALEEARGEARWALLGPRQRDHRPHAEPHPLPTLGERTLEKALATGDPTNPPTIAAPADSPKIVTLFGLPPLKALDVVLHPP